MWIILLLIITIITLYKIWQWIFPSLLQKALQNHTLKISTIDPVVKKMLAGLENNLNNSIANLNDLLGSTTKSLTSNFNTLTNSVKGNMNTLASSTTSNIKTLNTTIDSVFKTAVGNVNELTKTAITSSVAIVRNANDELLGTIGTINTELTQDITTLEKALNSNLGTVLNIIQKFDIVQITDNLKNTILLSEDGLSNQLHGTPISHQLISEINKRIITSTALLRKITANAGNIANFLTKLVGTTAIKIATNNFGEIGLHCPDGYFQNGLFCSKLCKPGESPDGLGNCYAPCPAGWNETLTTCNKPAPYGRVGRIPDQSCPAGLTYVDILGVGNCLSGIWFKQFANKSCRDGEEFDGILCYPKCKQDYHPVGCCICSPDCPAPLVDMGLFCSRPARNAGANVGILEAGVCPDGYVKSKLGTGCVKAPTFGIVNLTCPNLTDKQLADSDDPLLLYQKSGCPPLDPIILDARGITYPEILATAKKYGMRLATRDEVQKLYAGGLFSNLKGMVYSWIAVADSYNEWLYVQLIGSEYAFGKNFITHSEAVGYKPSWGTTATSEGSWGRGYVLLSKN